MGVHHDGQVHRVLQGRDQVIGVLRGEDAGHVLDADRADAHFLQFLDHLHILVQGVHRARGIGDRAGGHGAAVHGFLNGHLQVVDVVQGVKNADDVDAVADRGAHKATDDVVTVVLVAQDVLAAQQHLQLGVGHLGADLSEPLPGVFIQETQADVKGGAAPHLGRIVAGLVDGLQDGLKLVVGQAGCNERLVRVTQNGFGKLYFFHA